MLVRSFIAFVLVWAQSVALVGLLPAGGSSGAPADTMDCVLCELAMASGDRSLVDSCDCGCLSSTDRIPDAPAGVVLGVERVSAMRAPERASLVRVDASERDACSASIVDDRASVHTDVLGFLALIGVWLN